MVFLANCGFMLTNKFTRKYQYLHHNQKTKINPNERKIVRMHSLRFMYLLARIDRNLVRIFLVVQHFAP